MDAPSDKPDKDLDLVGKVKQLEIENRKIHDEFNVQRAKLKEIFLQKESECFILKKQLDEMKSQFFVAECKKDNEISLIDRKAQEEISSLQHIVQETMEESTVCKNDLEKLLGGYNRLKMENERLKEELLERQEQSSLVPVFSQVKTFTKKLVGDSSTSSNVKEENLEDNLKSNKYAQEDAEVLRSLVVPLEEEIEALKEKLRSADCELQYYRNKDEKRDNLLDKFSAANEIESVELSMQKFDKSTSMQFGCENCVLNGKNISRLEQIEKNDKAKLYNLEKILVECKEELAKEAALRKDLENQWQDKREIHREEVIKLTEQIQETEKDLNNVTQKFFAMKGEIKQQLLRLSEDRENINKHLEALQSDNDYLSGKFLASSEELENQNINLPNNVEELHEQILQLQNDLLRARVGVEFEKRRNVVFIDENTILREQLKLNNQESEAEKLKVQNQIKSLNDRVREYLIQGEDYETKKEKAERKESEMSKNISELRVQVIELQGENEKLKRNNDDLKSKIINLQEDLKISEDVQKDFVKLSQSLQITLEGIRQADTQVRWQDDEDIEKCPNCAVMFTVTCRKQHCRHCGKIFCEKCLTKAVPSGPRQKLARVCDICHTVLTPNTAPYFSKEPPNSPL